MIDFKVNGLVIRESDSNEYDKVLTILTEKHGKLYVIGKGAKSLRSRHMATTQLLSYASYNLRKKGNFYYITDSDLIENYYDIRNDITKVALASYICDVACEFAREEAEESNLLKLVLNTFYAIAKNLKPLEIIRASFEIRIAAISGFMPDLTECSRCGDKNPQNVCLDIMDGIIICEKCRKETFSTIVEDAFYETKTARPICIFSSAVNSALKYVMYSRPERFLSFSLDESEHKQFFEVCERYLLNHLERSFYSLEFYKSLL